MASAVMKLTKKLREGSRIIKFCQGLLPRSGRCGCRAPDRFQDVTEIAIGRNDRGRSLREGRAGYLQSTAEGVQLLSLRRSISRGVNARRLGIGLAFGL